MRIVFFGTPDFAVATLEQIVEHKFEIVAVVTAPDKPSGRGQQVHQSAVKEYALSQNFPVMQPENMKDELFCTELKKYNADLQIVVAFRMMPEKVWNMPHLGTMNLHASLLPQYRGAAPINWAIINGETKTGVTTFMLKHEIDTGNILLQKEVDILPDDNFGSMYQKLKKIGAQLVIQSLKQIMNNDYQLISQETLVLENLNHAPKINKELGRINTEKNVESIHNLVRGLSPVPAAYYDFEDKSGKIHSLKIFQSSIEVANTQNQKGIVTDHKTYLKIVCKNGYILLHDVQLQGKKRMGIVEFLRGFRF